MSTMTWLITGASSGLGRGIARAALLHGDRVAVTARDPHKLEDLADQFGDRVLPLPMEVTDPAQRHAVVARTVQEFGGIDILVNNAGKGHFGSVEDSTSEDISLLFQTNFFGPVGMIREVLPHMRKAGTGTIVNTSSMGVMFEGATGNAYYVASKAALEMLSDVLGNEVEPLGIHVMILEPGSFRTEFRVAAIQSPNTQSEAYEKTATASMKYLSENPYNQPGDPAKAGEALYVAVHMNQPPKVLILGRGMIEVATKTLDDRKAEISKWRHIAEGTDY